MGFYGLFFTGRLNGPDRLFLSEAFSGSDSGHRMDMGIDKDEGSGGCIACSGINENGSSQKIISRMDHPAPMDRVQQVGLIEAAFPSPGIQETAKIDPLMGTGSVPHVAPPLSPVAEQHARV